MNHQATALCFGELLWDCFQDDLLENKGIEGPKRILGGAPSNLCYFLNQLGFPATLVTAIGDDSLGREALAQFQQHHIPVIAAQNKFPTGRVDITIIDQEPHYQFATPAAWDQIPLTPEILEKAAATTLIAYGSLAMRSALPLFDPKNIDYNDELNHHSFTTLKAILENNPQAMRFCDLNLRAPYYSAPLVDQLLRYADLLKLNEMELRYLQKSYQMESLSLRDTLYHLIERFELNAILLTLGAEGSIVMSPNDYSALSGKSITLADSIGAGDSFSAAFITALYKGASFQEAHQFAHHLSHYVCTQSGAFITLPDKFSEKLTTFQAW
ncbi:bifunctional hydroxymethylpyrimidine kinase/phosphomethylpyrimidine kinase [Ignatzschineria indica]|uniref:PfkB family carbohydrate kinase n=1 Tax=Ignatzschineria indica TaxID=472583 RepID=UPI002577DBA8|nr:PfkB family carbohydrate kinase [Ignatzschineria indica]MDM1546189.1 bifunctional hydroxymethylpyrimidine kinase/phosphomethylpyrimidine kinase [Ignatzschineria indica]